VRGVGRQPGAAGPGAGYGPGLHETAAPEPDPDPSGRRLADEVSDSIALICAVGTRGGAPQEASASRDADEFE